MKQFIENTLHQQVEINPYVESVNLPPIFQGNYELFVLKINGESCLLAEPKGKLSLTTLRKQQRRLEQLTEKYCVLYLKNMQAYPRDKMLEEGIPFIWENHQMYMPFMGILLKKNEARELRPCLKVSFLTQKLLLTALYDQWENVTVSIAAELLQVTKMSITRCYDEIESLGIPVICKKGRSRIFNSHMDKKEMWNLIKPYMRDPLLREFYFEEDISCNLMKSGISALCEYSLLNDDYRTYAITKSQLSDVGIKSRKQVPVGELIGCTVQELGYAIDYKEFGSIDPLTVYMLLEEEAKEDPRVDKALEEMLEEHVW